MSKILIVDDRPANRQFLVTLLGYAGNTLLEADNGAEALEIARAEHPDLIITDILMPVMDGYEMARQLRADRDFDNTPLVFYTATYHAREARSLARAAGVQYVLTKPAEPQAILELVDTALGRSPAPAPAPEIATKPLLDPLQIVSQKLAAKMEELGGITSRLSSLIALGIEIGGERDPQRLLEKFCDSSRKLLEAKYAAVGIISKDGRSLEHFITAGMDPETVARLGPPPTGKGILGLLLTEYEALRLRDLTSDPRAAGFPPGHPRMRSFLGVPIATSLQVYGRLYLTEKIGAEEFSEEDERVAVTLAAQVAVAYENAQMYYDIQTHAAKLQLEITERQKAEAALEASHKRFQSLVEHAPDGIALLGADGKLRQVTPSTQQILGYTLEEAVGQDPAALTHPDDLPDLLALLNDLIQNPEKVIRTEYRFRHKDGSWRWLESTVTNLLAEPSVGSIVFNYRDITERKRSAEQLNYHARLLRRINDAVIATDDQFRITAWNRSAERMYGWSSEEVIGRNVTDILSSELTEEQQAVARQLLEQSHISRGERIYSHKNGQTIAVDENTIVLADEHGKMSGYVSVHRDITERKRAEEALRESEEHYRNLFIRILHGFALHEIICDENGQPINYRFLEINPAFEALTGLRASEVVGRTVLEILPGTEQHWIETYGRVALTGESIQFHNYSQELGKYYDIMAYCPKPGQFAVLFSDVTERKRAEEQIQLQVQRLRSLRAIDVAISSSFNLGLTLDILVDQVIAQLNVDAAAVLLFQPNVQRLEHAASRGFHSTAIRETNVRAGQGYAGKAILERRMIHSSSIMAPDGELSQEFLRMLEEEGFIDYYCVPLLVKGEVKGALEIFHRSVLTGDAEWLHFLETLAGQAAIAIQDATLFENLQRANAELEHRVAERTAELNQTNAELERANRAKDEFLANMSHELRTPLNVILGLSEVLLEYRRGPLTEPQERALHMISSSGQHLLRLINDILDVSKIEAGKLQIHPDVISVKEVCESSLNFLREQALKKSISLDYWNRAEIKSVYADPQRLKQILVNLLNNAVKFTPEKGNVSLEVEINEERDQIQFIVTDTGIGISPEDLQKLFTPFTQLDSSLSRQYAGTGLGLVLVYKFTELHGGSVHVESKVGTGSRFTIALPWSETPSTPTDPDETVSVPVKIEPEESTSPAQAPGLVLLVEDNESNILVVTDYLQEHGFQVALAHNGFEALDQAEQFSPSLILMDIQMPEMDGVQAIRRLRAIPRFASTPIIALTALAMPGDRERCLEAGANEYMSKPVSLKTLLKTIRKLLTQGG